MKKEFIYNDVAYEILIEHIEGAGVGVYSAQICRKGESNPVYVENSDYSRYIIGRLKEKTGIDAKEDFASSTQKGFINREKIKRIFNDIGITPDEYAKRGQKDIEEKQIRKVELTPHGLSSSIPDIL